MPNGDPPPGGQNYWDDRRGVVLGGWGAGQIGHFPQCVSTATTYVGGAAYGAVAPGYRYPSNNDMHLPDVTNPFAVAAVEEVLGREVTDEERAVLDVIFEANAQSRTLVARRDLVGAADKATKLLLRLLDDTQRSDYEKNKWFFVDGDEFRYKVILGLPVQVYNKRGFCCETWCAVVNVGPPEDTVIGQLLYLRHDPRELRALARVTRYRECGAAPIEGPADDPLPGRGATLAERILIQQAAHHGPESISTISRLKRRLGRIRLLREANPSEEGPADTLDQARR